MRQITRLQLSALWLCLAYFAFAFLVVGSRAAFGFLRLGSEYRDAQVPREILMSVADSASRDFRLHALLIAIGFAMLGGVLIWLTRSQRV
jgi:hypothetical protein